MVGERGATDEAAHVLSALEQEMHESAGSALGQVLAQVGDAGETVPCWDWDFGDGLAA